jgi:hypothetical protein
VIWQLSIPPRVIRSGYHRALAVCALLLLYSCTTSVPIVPNIPTPLIAPLPMRVAVFYDPGLEDFQHTEEIPGGMDYEVKLGNASELMLSKLFASMFEQVEVVGSLEEAFSNAEQYDAIINPAMLELQISPPSRLESDFFEAWVKYRIDAFDKQRDPIVKWIVTGYGKAEPETLGSSSALQSATIIAMRDAAANIVIKFKRQPRVKAWIEEQEHAHAVSTK